MMSAEQHLLSKLMEECSEVSQRASKSIQFGMRETQKGQRKNNAERLIDEWVDLHAVFEMLYEAGFIQRVNLNTPFFRTQINEKKRKIAKYAAYSRSLGRLEPKPPTKHERKIQIRRLVRFLRKYRTPRRYR